MKKRLFETIFCFHLIKFLMQRHSCRKNELSNIFYIEKRTFIQIFSGLPVHINSLSCSLRISQALTVLSGSHSALRLSYPALIKFLSGELLRQNAIHSDTYFEGSQTYVKMLLGRSREPAIPGEQQKKTVRGISFPLLSFLFSIFNLKGP